MMVLTQETGQFVKAFRIPQGREILGFHKQFGFVTESSEKSRARRCKLSGFKNKKAVSPWLFQLGVSGKGVDTVQGCEALQTAPHTWRINSPRGTFFLFQDLKEDTVPVTARVHQLDTVRDRAPLIVFALSVLTTGLLIPFLLNKDFEEPVAEIVAPIEIKIVTEVSKPVNVQPLEDIPEIKTVKKEVKRAVEQKLGFLGLLGRKDLRKALGGIPSTISQASPGAGAGGVGGSGGELLVGLGQGVKRTTVGNTGVKGLGGIGTKGAGGGAGGYGNTLIGSGEGKGLSSIPLSKDLVLEGGLDRSVIQATIAKYLSQVRACYEEGLRRAPGIAGQVTLYFQIGASGAVDIARVQQSTLGDAPVENCIVVRAQTWKFPQPVGGVAVKVNYPFLLKPTGT